MERTAYSRAWDYLSYSPGAKWLAVACAAGSAVFFVILILILGLFIDLLVTAGRIPDYAELHDRERVQFRKDWNDLDENVRASALDWLPSPMTAADRSGYAEQVGDDLSASLTHELRWKAYVGRLIHMRAGGTAAEAYRSAAHPDASSVAASDAERVKLGIMSLVVRARHHPVGHAVGWAARLCPWTWRPTESGVANRPYLILLLVLAMVVAVVRFLLAYLMNHFAANATLEAITRIRRLIYHHANRLGSLTITDAGPTEAVGTFTREVESVHDGMYAQLTVAVREPVKLILLTAVALSIHLWLGLAFVCAALLVWLFGLRAAAYLRRQGRFGARGASNQLSLLQESIQMMRLVKGYLMELFNQARVERQLSEYARAQAKRFRGESVYRPLLVALGTLVGSALLFVAGWVVLTGGLSVSGLITMGVALVSLYIPIDVWMGQRRLVARSQESAVALFDLLDRRSEVGQVVGAEFLKSMSESLEFDEVSLREPGTGRMLLDGANLTIQAGQRVAIVGADDAERHALASLIPRFLDPSSGEIRIDGRNIRWVTLDSLRNQVALVMQQNLIFNDTVANNIGCGDPSYSIPQIIEAAKLVHAHSFVQKLPYGYETPIGQLGHTLSIGQQFRVALARAVLSDPAVMIIEEPDDVLDDGSKDMLDDAYARILPGRTVIFLPHRLSTLKSCDHVFLVHEGKLEAEGEHRALLQESELYRHLYYMEYNMFSNRH